MNYMMYMHVIKRGVFFILCLLITLNGFAQTVNSPVSTSYPQSTTNQAVSGFSLTGFNATATLLVTIGLVNPPSGTTLRLGNTSGISASTGYTLSSNFTRISFTGTQANINTVLSSLLVNTGSVPGNVYIAVTATVNPTGYFYFPPNGHFYRPITNSGINYTNAKTGAAAETFKGQTGYLVTITSQDEQNFIHTNVPLNNIWIALSDVGLEGRWRIDAGPEDGTLVWTASANVNNSTTNSYSSAGTTASGQYVAWASNEPNNDDASRGGEDHGITKFNGNNSWNDLNNGNSSQVGGYVVEFGTWSDPADQTFTDFSTGFVTHQIGCTPANAPSVPTAPSGARMGNGTTVLNATAPSGSVIDWYANASGGNVLAGGTGVSTFTTTTNLSVTSYYAQSRNSSTGCVSLSRTLVIVPGLPPNAINDTVSTPYNVSLNINPLSNDVVGSYPLVATSIQFLTGTAPNASTVGVFVINPNGTVTFTAASNYSGVATIGYRIFDQDNQSDSAYIVVNVSGPCSVDGDFDGIADCLDEYPTDTYKAFNNYFPPNDYATLMYEDLWPHIGDYDLNDVVINYQANTITNGLNQVVEMNYTIVARCTGAGLHNGFAFQLDNVPSNKITSVSGAKASGASWLSIGSNGLENGQSFANVIVYDDLYKVLPYPGSGTVINTEMSAARTPNDTSNIVITFINDGVVPSGGTISISNLPHTAFNPYLILGDSGTLNQIRSKELHLADRVPSSKMDFSLFGTKKDNSNPGQGRYYKTANNLPWALQISTSVPYMQEKEDIATGYLKFLDWATSNGTTNTNWYLDLVGHRDSFKLYTK